MKSTIAAVAFFALAVPAVADERLPFEQTQLDRALPEVNMESASTGKTSSAPRQVPSFEQYNPV